MTIEQKIKKIIDDKRFGKLYDKFGPHVVLINYSPQFCFFVGLSIRKTQVELYDSQLTMKNPPIQGWIWYGAPEKDHMASVEVCSLLEEADITECLTSRIEYIRECKKWITKKST